MSRGEARTLAVACDSPAPRRTGAGFFLPVRVQGRRPRGGGIPFVTRGSGA